MRPSNESQPSPAMVEALLRRSGGRGELSFADFMDVALYEPGIGYYRKAEKRIGLGPDTDFFTATSSALFGKLVSAACVTLLGKANPRDFTFVELGAETGTGVLSGVDHPFRATRIVGIGEPIAVAGPSIVFSNELLDAQPFRRFRKTAGKWVELGVSIAADALAEVELAAWSALEFALPEDAPDGYVFDAPIAAADLTRSVAQQDWTGLFLAFDYGKSWAELAHHTPEGTARSYRRHVQGNDLLCSPGEQDLTCHVCWDWIEKALSDTGFAGPKVESQEAFFVHHAGSFIKALMESQGPALSRDKLSLMQLLHPANMGQKFQALWSLRNL